MMTIIDKKKEWDKFILNLSHALIFNNLSEIQGVIWH